VADFGTPIAAEYSKPSLRDIISDTLDTPVNNASNPVDNSSQVNNASNPVNNPSQVNNTSNPLLNRISEFNPNATMGEVIACNVMFEEQLNKTNTDFDLSLYLAYINNSNSYPIEGLSMTAKELYNQAPGVKSFIDGLDAVLVRYSHMSKEEKVEFLLTKTPCDQLTNEIMDKADANELSLFSQKAFSAFDDFPTYNSKTVDIGKAQAFQKETEKRIDTFNHDMLYYDKYYSVYGNDLEENLNDFNITKDNTVETLNKAISTMTTIRNQFLTAGIIIMIVAVILICIGAMFLNIHGLELITSIINKFSQNVADIFIDHFIKDTDVIANNMHNAVFDPTGIAYIIGAILLAIGLGLLGLAIYLIVFAEVTIKNLQDRVTNIRDNLVNKLNI
jgi:hypothetical protein